jgi:HK97 family phage major capsid protein
MTSTAYSRLALIQTTPDIGNMVMDDLALVVAIGLDLAALSGTGTLQPTGVRGQSGVGTRAMGTDGANLTWANVVGYETDIAVQNADISTLAFLTTPGVRGKNKTILKTTVAGSDFLWDAGNTMNGYRAEVTNQLPTNLTKGTSTTICHALVFGNWRELLIGEWGGAVEFLVNPYTYSDQNMIAVHGYVITDIAVRHPKSFVVTNDILVI